MASADQAIDLGSSSDEDDVLPVEIELKPTDSD